MNIDFTFYLTSLAFLLALLTIAYKFYIYKQARTKEKIYVHFKMLGFYSDEQIHSTTSGRKRAFMVKANYVTIAMYVFLLPLFILVIFNLVLQLGTWLDAI